MNATDRLQRELYHHRAIAPTVTLRRSLTMGRQFGFVRGGVFRALGRTDAGAVHIETLGPVAGWYRAAHVREDDLDGLPKGF
ncbi:MAG: hypothetical protein PHR30_18710 [Gallionellaceae bacterium]|nr:hypothetical protein [Gallionellaceae bacterium]